MFTNDSQIEIQERLKILYFLHLYDEIYEQTIEVEQFIDFFIKQELYTYMEISTLVHSMISNNLISLHNFHLKISDHGVVALSFFKDQLPVEDQTFIEQLISLHSHQLVFFQKEIFWDEENRQWILLITCQGETYLDLRVKGKEEINPLVSYERETPERILRSFGVKVEDVLTP